MDGKIRAVVDAWNIPGAHPGYHEHTKNKLRRKWPILADALDDLHVDGYCDNTDCCDKYHE